MLLVACVATRSLADGGAYGISTETAQRLYERVKQVRLGDGYHFDGLGTNSTNKSELTVEWSLHGQPCPTIHVVAEDCATLRLGVPPDLSTACPDLQAVVNELARAVPTEHAAGHGYSSPWGRLPAIAVLAWVLMAAWLIRHAVSGQPGTRLRWWEWVVIIAAVGLPFLFDVARAVTAELALAWVLFIILLFDRDLFSGKSVRQGLSLCGLFLFSVWLHWLLASGGPGDLHLNLSAIWSFDWSSKWDRRWGPAPIALVRLLGTLFGPIRDTHIIWCNVILSSLVPLLLYGVVSELGVGHAAAWLAALVATMHPLLISFAGVLERQPIFLFAASGSLLALIDFLKRAQWSRLAAFIVGSVLAITSRPEAAHVLIVDGAVLLLTPGIRRARALAACSLALLLAVSFAYVSYSGDPTIGGRSIAGQFPLLWTVLFDRNFTPLAWIVAWVLGVLLSIRQRAAWIAVVSLFGLDMIWRWTRLYSMFVGFERQVASARYESILLIPFTLGMALFIQAMREASRWLTVSAGAAFLLSTVATFRLPYDTLLQPFTVDHEYRFLKKYALTLAPGSRLYVFDTAIKDIGFMDAGLVGQFVGSDVCFESWRQRTNATCDDLNRHLSQSYLYIGSSCAELIKLSSPEYEHWMQECRAIRAAVSDAPVEEIDVPARRMAWDDFKDSIVRLGVYRLKDPSVCTLGPRLPSSADAIPREARHGSGSADTPRHATTSARAAPIHSPPGRRSGTGDRPQPFSRDQTAAVRYLERSQDSPRRGRVSPGTPAAR
jgi:hypothetical protein